MQIPFSNAKTNFGLSDHASGSWKHTCVAPRLWKSFTFHFLGMKSANSVLAFENGICTLHSRKNGMQSHRGADSTIVECKMWSHRCSKQIAFLHSKAQFAPPENGMWSRFMSNHDVNPFHGMRNVEWTCVFH